MSFSPVPDYLFGRLTDVSAGFLQERGISFLMLDLDNTIAPYGATRLPEETLRWGGALADGGITLFIVSNSRNDGRVRACAGQLGIGYLGRANKPLRAGVRRAMAQNGKAPAQSALAGDQVYTDVLAANAAGATSIAVRPMGLQSPIFALRYALEKPFRKRCKNIMPEAGA